MYLRKMYIVSLKLIRELRLSFLRGDEPRMWTVLLAENGHCKTTVLQAIALAASGATRGNQLAEVPGMSDRRREGSSGVLDGEFYFPGPPGVPAERPLGAVHLESQLHFGGGSATLYGGSTWLDISDSEVKQPLRSVGADGLGDIVQVLSGGQVQDPLSHLRSHNHSGALVVGYGVSRVLPEPETSPLPDDPARDRLRSLFERYSIVGTDFVGHLAVEDPDLALAYVDALNDALLSVPELLPGITHFERRGRNGVNTPAKLIHAHRFVLQTGGEGLALPATWLSQGYQSTISWIADLIGQAFWDGKQAVAPTEMTGLVLIDELDLHLHPRWQVTLVRSLKRIFPKMQFVVTTHSPMLLPGFEADEVIRLGQDDAGNIIQLEERPSPKLMTGSELYANYFGLRDYYPDELGAELMRYGTLAGDPGRSPAEQAELEMLRAKLAEAGIDPGWEPVDIDPDLQRVSSP